MLVLASVRGIQLRVEGDQGGGADDTGLNEFKLKCFKLANGYSEAAADTKTLTFTSTTWGDWDAKYVCTCLLAVICDNDAFVHTNCVPQHEPVP